MPQTYTVKKGETLSGIAQQLLGAASRWKEFGYQGDPTKLQPGTVLTIPGAEKEVTCPPGYKPDPVTKACVPITEPEAGAPPTVTPPTGEPVTIGGIRYPSQQWYDINITGKGKQAIGGREVPITPAVEVDVGVTDKDKQARDDAADQTNQEAQGVFDNIKGDEVDMRDSTKILEDIQKKLEKTAEKIPAPTSLVDLFKEQKTKLGIDVLETELADLDADIERINTELLVQAEEAGEKLISTREIGRAKGVLQKRAEREIALINVERSAVARIMGNKIDTLNAIIKLTDMDYDNASDYYTKEYNRQVQLFNLVSGVEERELTHAERARDDAQANLVIVQNALKDGNLTYDALTADQKLKISQLETQSGFPSGLTAQIMTDEPDKKIQTVTSRTDDAGNTYFDVLLVDPDGAMSVTSIFRGKTAPTEAKKTAYWTAIDKQKKALRTGTDWGEAWDRIKAQFPDIADAEIDKDLGKISEGIDWSAEGAYEKWKAKEEEIDPVLLKDLKDAISVIADGADEDEIKRRFLEKHPNDEKLYNEYVGL